MDAGSVVLIIFIVAVVLAFVVFGLAYQVGAGAAGAASSCGSGPVARGSR